MSTEESVMFTNKIGRTIDSVNQSIIDKNIRPIKHIYIDICLIKDFYIGTILNCLSSKDEMSYLLKQLPYYNFKADRRFKTHFPNLSVSEEELHAYLHDDKNASRVFLASPDTVMSYRLGKIFSDAKNNNITAGEPDNKLFTVTINAYPLCMISEMEQYISIIQAKAENIARVKLISRRPRELSGSFWRSVTTAFVENFNDLVAPDSPIFPIFFSENALMGDTEFIAQHQVDNDRLIELSEQGYDIYDPVKRDEFFFKTISVISFVGRLAYELFPIPLPNNVKDATDG